MRRLWGACPECGRKIELDERGCLLPHGTVPVFDRVDVHARPRWRGECAGGGREFAVPKIDKRSKQ